MSVSITHAKVSGKAAGSDPDRVYGTHWDADHIVPVATTAQAEAASSDDVLMTPLKTLALLNANVTAGSGDVTGPSSSVDGEIALFDSTTGKVIRRASTTGVLKAASGVIAAAVSGTDYAPATSGSAILKGSGSGGFSNAAAGTDYVAPGGALGTPSSGTLTNCTGLPISTGVSGLGADVAAFLATPSSANLRTAVTDETGSGALVFATSPTLVTPALGTPASGTLTNCTGLPASGLVASTSQAVGFGSIELGHASDTTLARDSAGVMSVEGKIVAMLSQAQTFSAKQTFTSTLSLQQAIEKVTITADNPALGDNNFNLLTQAVQYYTTANDTNWTINVRGDSGTSLNTVMATGEAVTLAVIVTNTGTAYYQSAMKIDGSAVTPKWVGGAPSAGTVNSTEMYVFTIIKTASATFTVLGQKIAFT